MRLRSLRAASRFVSSKLIFSPPPCILPTPVFLRIRIHMQEYIDFIVRNPLLSAAWLGLLVAVIYTSVRALLSPIKTVGLQAAVQLINRDNAVVVDVRSQDEFSRGHIAGSHNVSTSQIDANNLTVIEKFKSNPIIVVCESGTRAVGSAGKLNKAGFTQVYLLRGGLADWRAENLPITKKR